MNELIIISSYRALFILPNGTYKKLTEDGWKFSSPQRIHESQLTCLLEVSSLYIAARYLDMRSYKNSNIDIIAIEDDEHRIEHIYVKVRMDYERYLVAIYQCLDDENELFIPWYQ